MQCTRVTTHTGIQFDIGHRNDSRLLHKGTLQPYKSGVFWGKDVFLTSALSQPCHMASLQQVVEQLALLAAAGTNGTAGPDTTSSVTSPPRGPLDLLATTFKILFSASALRDWAVLLVIGSLFETARRLLASLWYWLISSFFVTAVFEDDDMSFRTALV